ncbi:hypothetical protein HSX11_13470 [Oxalobacteraceae bacterium]|nr:hypothetical protein [Oxalobacteraceae bacterium]
MPSDLLAYRPELELNATGKFDGRADADLATLGFAAEALELRSAAALDRLIERMAAQGGMAPQVLRGTLPGRALRSQLRRAALAVLPLPGQSSAALAALKTRAARILGLELEGLSPEDKEFEVAQQFVRFAQDAIRRTAAAPGAAQAALVQAARHHAPGLLRHGVPQHGRWLRAGQRLIVLDC